MSQRFPVMFKYMKKIHAQGLLTMGLFRVGTLYDYRRDEHGAKIKDNKEGIIYPRTVIEDDEWTSSPPHLEQFIKIEGKSKVKLENIHLSSIEQSDNLYLYCVSDRFSKVLYDNFDADVCIKITNVEKFFFIIGQTISNYVKSNPSLLLQKVKYVDRYGTHEELYRQNPALVKDTLYEEQHEMRCCWQPLHKNPQPIVSGNYRLIEHCEWYDEKS